MLRTLGKDEGMEQRGVFYGWFNLGKIFARRNRIEEYTLLRLTNVKWRGIVGIRSKMANRRMTDGHTPLCGDYFGDLQLVAVSLSYAGLFFSRRGFVMHIPWAGARSSAI